MKRACWFLLSLLLLLPVLTSCHAIQSVPVSSRDYPNLTHLEAAEFDAEELFRVWSSVDNPYEDYRCSVSVENGKLVIRNAPPKPATTLVQFDCGYFLGVNIGEFDGWVRYYPYFSNLPEAGESRLVVDEACCGMVAIDRVSGILLTDCSGGIVFGTPSYDLGSIYWLYLNRSDLTWSWEKIAGTKGLPRAICPAENGSGWYIVTTGELLHLSADLSLTKLTDSQMLDTIWALDSIVEWNGKLWCGSPMGVYCFDPQTQSETWYPMDYETYLPS